MNILCYQYGANYHCIECTVKRYKANGFYRPTKDNQLYNEWNETHSDENDISYDCFDSEDNPIYVVFSGDEWQELDEDFVSENPIQFLACGTCHEIIEIYKSEACYDFLENIGLPSVDCHLKDNRLYEDYSTGLMLSVGYTFDEIVEISREIIKEFLNSYRGNYKSLENFATENNYIIDDILSSDSFKITNKGNVFVLN